MKILTLKNLKKEIDEIKEKIIKKKAIVLLNRHKEQEAIEDLKKLGWKEELISIGFGNYITLEKEF